jgi:transcriptional regulator with XRE-family HTH domain
MTGDYVRTILSNNLRKLRNRREWSQAELAKEANISVTFLSEIERGRKWPYPKTLQRLAAALGVEVYEFFRPAGGENSGVNRFSTGPEKPVKNIFFNVK